MTEADITLVPLAEAHLPMTLEWRNRPEVRRWFKHSAEISPEDHRAWFKSYVQKPNDWVYVVYASGVPVGQVAVYNLDKATRTAEIGRFIAAPEYRGRGYLRRGIAELLHLAGLQFGITSFYLEVFADNETALGLYEKLGFRVASRADAIVRMDLDLSLPIVSET